MENEPKTIDTFHSTVKGRDVHNLVEYFKSQKISRIDGTSLCLVFAASALIGHSDEDKKEVFDSFRKSLDTIVQQLEATENEAN